MSINRPPVTIAQVARPRVMPSTTSLASALSRVARARHGIRVATMTLPNVEDQRVAAVAEEAMTELLRNLIKAFNTVEGL